MRIAILISAYIIANAIDKDSITLDIKIIVVLLLSAFAFTNPEKNKE